MQKNSILFFTPGKNAPASRFRVLQYIKYLEEYGFTTSVSHSVPDKDFSPRQVFPKIYGYNKWLGRIAGIIAYIYMFMRRCWDILFCLNYDIIFLQRDILPFRSPILEKIIRLFHKKIIFDFDDAIYLKNEKKIAQIIKISKHVIAGNKYLFEFAKRYSNNVSIIPTVVDTTMYLPKADKQVEYVTIGYVGSPSTLKYLAVVKNCFSTLTKKYPNTRMVILSIFEGTDFQFIENTIYRHWAPENEISEINGFDIGIMPLVNDEWSSGKCGAKLLQYMALGIPVVASPIGVNEEIVKDGINGFLADTDEKWISKSSLLIEDNRLRKRVGNAGRKTVEERYSVTANLPKLIEIFNKATE